MKDTYKCECGHTIHTSSKEPPKFPNWSGGKKVRKYGHICVLVKQEKEKE